MVVIRSQVTFVNSWHPDAPEKLLTLTVLTRTTILGLKFHI